MHHKDPHRYDDIIHLPHHESSRHPRMSDYNRAAQFSPFAALTGYEDSIQETARYTDNKIILDENERAILDHKLQQIYQDLPKKYEYVITHFVEDLTKEGGSYEKSAGIIKRINLHKNLVIFYDEDGLHDGLIIPISNIINIDGESFKSLDYTW